MRRIILSTLTTLALTAPAFSFDHTITYAPYYKFSPGASARMINIPPPLSAAEREALAIEDRKWLAFCKPTRHVDEFNVTRLSYAHDGCEFGRSE